MDFLILHLCQVLILEDDIASGDARRRHRQDTQDGFHGGGFATTRFTNQSDLLASVDFEIDAVHDLQDTPIYLEFNTQVSNLEQSNC